MRRHRESGVTVIELVAALAVFALLFLVVDAVFFAANRGSKKAELAADVQQNARIALERLVREVREAAHTSTDIVIGGSTGARSVVFRSARLASDNSVFCLYVRNTSDPTYIYNSNCFLVGSLIGPPYLTAPVAPLGTYTPIWQRYIAYQFADGEVRRTSGPLATPSATLPDSATLSGWDVIATYVESFDISKNGTKLTIALKAKGQSTALQATVQGSALPAQEILLDGIVIVRN